MAIIHRSTLALAIAMSCAVPASASVIASFSYIGEVVFAPGAGSPVAPLNAFPTDGASNIAGFDLDDGPLGFAARVGYGEVTPTFGFGSGAVAAGDVTQVRSQTIVELKITNDSAVQRLADWQFLIFAGGVGLNTPDFSSPGCSAFAIDQCDAWLSNLAGGDIGVGDTARVNFSVVMSSLAGNETLFAGELGVAGQAGSGVGLTADFSPGFSLAGFDQKGVEYSWDQTLVEYALGLFEPGEMKTLTFVTESFASSTGFCDSIGDGMGSGYKDCVTAFAGYGDPPGGGGRRLYRKKGQTPPPPPTVPPDFPGSLVNFIDIDGGNPTSEAPEGMNPPTTPAPAPATSLLLLLGLASLQCQRRRRCRT